MLNPDSCECYLFVGPTLYRERGGLVTLPMEVKRLPPVVRGDVATLCRKETPGVMALADGLFHSSLAVGHIELREAIQAGWQVWGLCSMGAIRAYEMRHLGMRGSGEVYSCFAGEADFQDDEVALLHEPAPPYRPLTEPMVHLRAALRALEEAGHLSPGARSHVEARLKALWYGERTIRLVTNLVRATGTRLSQEELTNFLADFDRFRVKTQDLQRFLLQKPWRVHAEQVAALERPYLSR